MFLSLKHEILVIKRIRRSLKIFRRFVKLFVRNVTAILFLWLVVALFTLPKFLQTTSSPTPSSPLHLLKPPFHLSVLFFHLVKIMYFEIKSLYEKVHFYNSFTVMCGFHVKLTDNFLYQQTFSKPTSLDTRI